MTTHHLQCPRCNEIGATMMEFAVAFPLFMAFVMVIMDIGHVSSLDRVLHEGIGRTLAVATTVPNLDVDPRGIASTHVDYLRLMLARKKAEQVGLDFIDGLNVILTADDASLAGVKGPKLFDVVFTETRISDGPQQTTYKIAVLMPGECVSVPAIGHTECNRETLGTTPADPPPVLAPERLQEQSPVKAVAFVQYDGFTPWLFNGWRKAEQFSFRQPIPRGPFPAFEDPGLSGGVGAPPSPDDQQPLGKPKLPDEETPLCPVSLAKCIQRSMSDVPEYKSYFPCYRSMAVEADGFCYCDPGCKY